MSNAGICVVDITPPLGIDFIGYHRPEGIQNIDEHIFATAFIFEHKGKKSVFISIDNIGMLVKDTNKMRQQVAEKLKVTCQDVVIVYTHTHSGPATASEDQMVQSYKKELMTKVVRAAVQANETFLPCHVGWGVTEGNFGVNRREIGEDGKVKMGINLNGTVDKRIGVLGIKDKESKKWRGLIIFCTAHPNVLKGDSHNLSADYPGRVRGILQPILGCPIVVVQGAAGNVNARWRGSYKALEKMAQSLSGHVLSVVPELNTEPISKLVTASSQIPMQLKEIPEPDDIESMGNLAEKQWGVRTKEWNSVLLNKYKNKQRQLMIELEIQRIQINEGSFTGIPMEPFSESALSIKHKLGNDLAFFGGYTNGYLGYLPTREAFPYGGYEVELNPVVYGPITGLWMPPIETTSDEVVKKVLELNSIFCEKKPLD